MFILWWRKTHDLSRSVISRFSWHNSSVFFYLKHYVLLTKSSQSKCKFLDFPQPVLKFAKSFMSFFKQKSAFLQSLDHSYMSWKITPLYIFSWNFILLYKETIKSKFSDFWLLPWKLTKFLMLFFKPQVSFSFNIVLPFQ